MKRKSLLAALLAIATTASLAACVNNTTPTTSSVTPTTSSQAPTSEPTSAPTSAPTTSVAPSTSEATSEVSSTVVVEGVAIEHNETIAIQDFSTGDWLLPEGTTKLDYTEDMLFADYFTLKATSEKKWTVEADEDTSVTDGRKFTQKLKSGGKSNASGRFIQVETDKAVVLSIWAISNGADTRQIQIVSSDETEIAKLDVVGNELRRYDVTLEEPGAFNINMLASINIYGLELSDPNSKVKDLVKDLSIVGPDELKVGDTFDPTQYKVFGLDEEGCHGVLLNADEYTLTTVDTSVEANETAPAILTATHKDDAELVSNYKVEVYQWYDVVAPAETANGKITVPTEVKKGEPLTIYGTPDSGYEWKSATVKVNGEAVNAEIVNNQIKLESVTGNVTVEEVVFSEKAPVVGAVKESLSFTDGVPALDDFFTFSTSKKDFSAVDAADSTITYTKGLKMNSSGFVKFTAAKAGTVKILAADAKVQDDATLCTSTVSIDDGEKQALFEGSNHQAIVLTFEVEAGEHIITVGPWSEDKQKYNGTGEWVLYEIEFEEEAAAVVVEPETLSFTDGIPASDDYFTFSTSKKDYSATDANDATITYTKGLKMNSSGFVKFTAETAGTVYLLAADAKVQDDPTLCTSTVSIDNGEKQALFEGSNHQAVVIAIEVQEGEHIITVGPWSEEKQKYNGTGEWVLYTITFEPLQ